MNCEILSKWTFWKESINKSLKEILFYKPKVLTKLVENIWNRFVF